jgi:serine/threonine protein kinase/predicted nucleic acid-binding Zn ribbon protein
MDKIGTYQILEVLHRGPQPLYRAKAADGRVVALKAAPAADANAESRERFAREGETCRALDHPHVVRVLDVGEADGMMYQAMEMLDGVDLGKVMAEGREFSWDQKLAVMEQLCEGLQYAHEHNLVHRDIKPANLFLENSGRAVVLDFGMVRVAESELTKAGAAVGTVNYMAPEQIHGERCTPASDVFSAGIVFFQFASGRHPFSSKDKSLAQVVSAIVFEPAPKLSAMCPDAPEGLEFLLNKALEKDAAKRFRNAGELKQAIAVCRLAMTHGAAAPVAEKTKVFEKSAPVPAPAADEKTQVFQRPAAAVPMPPPKPAAPPAPVPEPVAPKPAPGLRFRYCPSCTTANPPDAVACSRCGTRLAEGGAAAAKSTNWGMYIAIGVAAVLAIVLLVVLMTKQ